MAKRKKSYKAKRRSGRRMGAAGSAMNSALGIIAGAAAAKLVQNFLPIQNDKLKAAAPLAVGLFLPRFVKGKFAADAATGMIAVGGLSLAQLQYNSNGLAKTALSKHPLISSAELTVQKLILN